MLYEQALKRSRSERNAKYDFRKRLEVVHKPNRRDPGISAGVGELESDDWRIAIDTGEIFVQQSLKVLQDIGLS